MSRRLLTALILFLFLHGNFDFILIVGARAASGSKTKAACCCANCSELDGSDCPCCKTTEAKVTKERTGRAHTSPVYKPCDPFSKDASIQYTAFDLCKFLTKRLTTPPESKPDEKEWKDARSPFAQYQLGAPLFHPP